ncbi:hypothetical protein CVT26_011132 [Gymnopilus dilepis]|uniref:Uncharacterized protein n=1 Tax=Gymnopilus dilepis TaxID=231916 RepID=A0A409VYV6_9AGAR|nr:hypothetical protein CVT26_011132 [Gymnopilus dilepis]
MALLSSRGIIPVANADSFYLAHGEWGRTKPLPPSSTLWELGILPYATLKLNFRRLGGSRCLVPYMEIPPAPFPLQLYQRLPWSPSDFIGSANPTASASRKRSYADIEDEVEVSSEVSPQSDSEWSSSTDSVDSASNYSESLSSDTDDLFSLFSDSDGEDRPPSDRHMSLPSTSLTTNESSSTSRHLPPSSSIPNSDVSHKAPLAKKPRLVSSDSGGVGGLEIVNGRYENRGLECVHSSQQDWDGVDWASNVALNELDESCLALSELNMCLYKPMNVILCKQHGRLLDLKTFIPHVQLSHRSTVPELYRPGKSKYDFLKHHVEAAFSISKEKSTNIHRPVPFVPPPHLYAVCPKCEHPFERSKDWSTVRGTMKTHLIKLSGCREYASEVVIPGRKQEETLIGTGDLQIKDEFWEEFEKTTKYGQLLARGRSGMPNWVGFLPQDWTPPSTTTIAHQVTYELHVNPLQDGIVDQYYAGQLGWDSAFQGNVISRGGRRKDMTPMWSRLLQWRAVPLDGYDLDDNARKEFQIIERGLFETRGFLYEYLDDANDFVKSCSDIFRRRLTKGSRSQYRYLRPSSLMKYKDTLFHPIALLIWLFHARHGLGRPLDSNIELHLTQEAKACVEELYHFILEVPLETERFPKKDLAIKVHDLLVELLMSQADVANKLGGPFDFAMALAAYKRTKKAFGSPTIPSMYCAKSQYCMRSIVVHLCRLFGEEAPYTLVGSKAGESNLLVDGDDGDPEHLEDNSSAEASFEVPPLKEINPLDYDEEIHGDLQDFDDSDDSDSEADSLSDDDNWLSLPSLATAKPPPKRSGDRINKRRGSTIDRTSQKDPLLSTLKRYSKWISNDGISEDSPPTAFQRMKSAWLVVWKLAVREMSSTQVHPDQPGLVFVYRSLHCPDHRIALHDIKLLATSFIDRARAHFVKLLPSGLDPEAFVAPALSDLRDNLQKTTSIFGQNEDKFAPLRMMLYNALMDEKEEKFRITQSSSNSRIFNEAGIDRWQGQENVVAEEIMGGLVWTMGMPGRAFQIAALCFGSSRDGKRNVFKIKGHLVIGWPKAKSFNHRSQASLWALLPELADLILLMFGVVRPVSLQLTEYLRRKPSIHATTHMFVTPPTKTGGGVQLCWSSARIDRLLKSRSSAFLGIDLSAAKLRQLVTAIYRKHFPDIINRGTTTTSAANVQAGHTQSTFDMNYGLIVGPLFNLTLTDNTVDQFMDVSHCWQALLGLLHPDPKTQERLHNSLYKTPLGAADENRAIALDIIRSLVCTEYKLGGACSEENQEKAQSILAAKPFLPKPGVNNLGDAVLVEVMSALTYGHARTTIRDAAPSNGYEPAAVAEAVALIMLGLVEWTTGSHKKSDIQDSNTKQRLQEAQQKVLSTLTALKENERIKWMQLSEQIFANSQRMALRFEVPDLLSYFTDV